MQKPFVNTWSKSRETCGKNRSFRKTDLSSSASLRSAFFVVNNQFSVVGDILGDIIKADKGSNSPSTTARPTQPILGLPDDEPEGISIATYMFFNLFNQILLQMKSALGVRRLHEEGKKLEKSDNQQNL